jgi:D-tyrosyl-tRNA(Tyr) deacylase
MRAVIQRVKNACVRVDGKVTGAIGKGLVVFAGVEKGDTEKDAEYIATKVVGLRVFEDTEGKMNLDLKAAGGGLLVVSQFTLLGDLRKGRRPSFDGAEGPQRADMGISAAEGVFKAKMEVELVNDGPVTLIVDSRKVF